MVLHLDIQDHFWGIHLSVSGLLLGWSLWRKKTQHTFVQSQQCSKLQIPISDWNDNYSGTQTVGARSKKKKKL
jgi:hypothetical protein